jgi:hypothetical protein
LDYGDLNSEQRNHERAANMNAKAKPVHQVRIGAIKASVWKNQSNGITRFNTTFGRLYKDGTEWKNSDSFGRDDLLVLSKVADHVHSWIYYQTQADE